jgi:putative oxidoreductase
MKIAVIIVRTLLGLAFLLFGLNVFLHFPFLTPKGDAMPKGEAGAFFGALFTSGYINGIGACEVAGGALLLIGRFVAVGLVFLGPVVVNILLYHLCLAHEGFQPGVAVALMELFLIYAYRDRFAGIFKA